MAGKMRSVARKIPVDFITYGINLNGEPSAKLHCKVHLLYMFSIFLILVPFHMFQEVFLTETDAN